MTDSDPAVRPLPFHVCVLTAATVVWFLLSLPHVTNAGAGFLWGCLLIPFTLVMIVFWFFSLVQIADAAKRDRRAMKAWCGCTALGLLVALFAFTPVGLTARVWLSAPALERLARELPPTGEETVTLEGFAGLFLVDRYEAGPDGAVAFYTCEAGFLDRAGILYLPPGATVPFRAGVEEHLYGPWYRFRSSF